MPDLNLIEMLCYDFAAIHAQKPSELKQLSKKTASKFLHSDAKDSLPVILVCLQFLLPKGGTTSY